MNPVISVPTGGGKTIIAGYLAKAWLIKNPDARVIILAHIGELVRQNHETLSEIIDNEVGIYSASLRKKQGDAQVVCANIQSVYKKTSSGNKAGGKVGKFDLIIVDEAHRIPTDSETMYKSFLFDQGWLEGVFTDAPKIVGLSATPYRMGTGKVYGLGKMFSELAHNVPILDLINGGFLCAPTSVKASTKTNFGKIKIQGGEYVPSDVERTMHPQLGKIVHELSQYSTREKWIVFTASIKQAEDTAQLLREKYGIASETIHSKMKPTDREQVVSDFREGKFKVLTNVNCLTEGFDVKDIDLVALLRPTKSTGLYVQMVGRGLRTHPRKQDVVILDFGQNISRHGPIDCPLVRAEGTESGPLKKMPTKDCPNCGFPNVIQARTCIECEQPFPVPQSKLKSKASALSILSTPAWFEVIRVVYSEYRNIASGKRSLRAVYSICDDDNNKQEVSSWMPFNHPSEWAINKCKNWWTKHHGLFPIPTSPQNAVNRIEELRKPLMVQVGTSKDQRFLEIKKLKFKGDGK